ncbi:MAG: hypothetical protein KDA62_01545, partial [Planctomycetales bacterium]|nr:hypothetical protein [Planctomycetales bacterium]
CRKIPKAENPAPQRYPAAIALKPWARALPLTLWDAGAHIQPSVVGNIRSAVAVGQIELC